MKKKIVLLAVAVTVMSLLSCDTAVSLGGGSSDGGSGSGSSSGGGNGSGSGKKYTLNVTASPSGAGTVTVSPNLASYDQGTSVTVTASPATGYKFNSWSGASSSTSSAITVVMDANKTLTAIFEQRPVASAVVITLTYWSTTDTDAGGLDPTIYFKVSYGSTYNTTSNLLYETDISQTWSGSKRSSPVSFSTSAGVIFIEAVVKERDLLFDDDISPSTYSTFYLPKYSGESGTETLSYGTGKSMVRYNYEFVQW